MAAVIAAFMPWATVFFVSVSGFDGGDGKLTAAAGAIAALLGVLCAVGVADRMAHIVSALCGAGITFVGGYNFVDLDSDVVSVGGGLYLTIAAGVAVVVAAIAAMVAPADTSVVRPTAAPGWYPDPAGSATSRWWDGQRWTDHTH